MTNQESKQSAIRGITGTTWDYNGDWMALFTYEGIASGEFNGRFLSWLRIVTGSALTDINGLKALYASQKGFNSWEAVNTIAPALAAGTLVKPSGFTPTIPFSITWDGSIFTTSLSITSYKATPTNTYYVSTTGSNANSGLTLPLAKSTIDGAISTGNTSAAPYTILVQGGTYDRNKIWSTAPTQDCNIIGENGTVILSAEQALTYTAASGAYTATRSVVGAVYDTNFTSAEGDYQRLTLVASVAACQATAGTWYTDNVSVWIHTIDSRDLAASNAGIKVYLKINPPRVAGNTKVYIENLNMEGFQTTTLQVTTTAAAQDLRIYANACSFKYCSDGNAVTLLGATLAIFNNCTAAYGYVDGFNYHIRDSIVPIVYEVGCTSRYNGWSGAESDNASTMHDGGSIFRVNSTYSYSSGRNIHDIDAATLSWNVGCDSNTSRSTTTTGGINWVCGDGDGTTTWLTKCTSSGSVVDWKVNTGGTLYINNALFFQTSVINGTAALFVQTVT